MTSDDDRFTTIPASGHYPGMTTYTDNGRTIKAVGTGEETKRVIREHLKQRKD